MSMKVYHQKDQAQGDFNHGAILENKPIGFPQDYGRLQPYSNLFYWAHAWTPGEKSLIPEHPHQGFEILSFVLEGSLEHYDDKNGWEPLEKGDVQIIRSGSGIRHAEMVNKTTSFFQIWFDPNINKTIKEAAGYESYSSESFDREVSDGITKIIYHDAGRGIQMVSPGIEMYELQMSPGSHSLGLVSGKVRSIYVIKGHLKVDGTEAGDHSFLITQEEESQFEILEECRLFIVDSLIDPGYKTYATYRSL